MKKLFILFIGLFILMSLGFAQNAWINEIHYDNVSTDANEAIEVVIENPGNYTLSDFTITLYNGNGGGSYGETHTLDSFTVGTTIDDFTIYSKQIAGIQNGAPDGISLDYQGTVIAGQFLSYEGSLTAVDGPANGLTSTDIGVSEPGTTPIGESLQLSGVGANYYAFTWQAPAAATFGNLNNGQTLGGSTDPTIIVTSPNGGEEWEQGSTHLITWNSINFEGNVDIELYMVYNRSREYLVTNIENDGEWEWNIPETQEISEWYTIFVSGVMEDDPYDESDATFSIIEPIPVNEYTIYEIQYSESGPSPHEGELIRTSGVVTALFYNSFFIQDGTGAWNGINVYPLASGLAVGDLITLDGTVTEYFEKTEITDYTIVGNAGQSFLPDPVIILTGDLPTGEMYEGVLVKMLNVIVTNPDLGNGEWEIDDFIDSSGPCRVDDLGDYTYVPVQNDLIY